MTEQHEKGYHIITEAQNVEDGEKTIGKFYAEYREEVCYCANPYIV